ncbi:hypothetical protein STAS_25843 [Striga asiatica]|uniref:Uncharacterized protein n=1 Tax=Striga asiatica TaxID=4170 RepID=A0A5A7QWB5_STRAF|nr:hypothetical protein STAS_25843 [Striga asiatica]
MELLNSRIPINPQSSPGIQFLTWNSIKFPPRLYLSSSRKYQLHPSFWRHPCRSFPSAKWKISALLGKPNSRQNYLRKKLTQQQQQQLQQQVSLIQHPVRKSDIDDSNFGVSSETIDNIEKNLETESKLDSFSEDGMNLESGSPGVRVNDSKSVEESETKSKKDKNGDSVLWNKLENWLIQYERDSELWGIGTGPIFTVFQNSDGKVERVIVNEDEIMRRARIDPMSYNDNNELAEVSRKISFAKDLANEMENGSNVIPRNSSVAKFLHSGGKSRFMEVIRGVTLKPGSFPKQSRVGFFVLCGLCLIWAVRGIFLTEKGKKITRLEKEMLQRKIKARAKNEKMAEGNVEIVTPLIEPKIVSFEKPQLNKEELVNSIIKAKESYSEVGVVQYAGYQNKEQKDKIKEIRAMARHAREIERKDFLADDHGKEDYPALEDLSRHSLNPQNEFQSREVYERDSDKTTELSPFTDGGLTEECETEVYDVPNVTESLKLEASIMKQEPRSLSTNEANHLSEGPLGPLVSSSRTKLRIIKSAKEAREYLSMKHQQLEVDQTDDEVSAYIASDRTSQNVNLTNEVNASPHLNTAQDFSHPSEDYVTVGKKAEENTDSLDDLRKSRMSAGGEVSVSSDSTEADSDSEDTENSEIPDKNEVADEAEDKAADLTPLVNKENWLEKNFNKFEPIVEKIGVGFKDNFLAAREKASLEPDLTTELAELKPETAYSELEWMKDERLAEIVFKVRDNELSGRDPFHLMNEEDKHAFFSGLEKKVQQENEKLLKLHEYFHSNIENLDYGADGISLYDPPEKIIPRWKVPPAETNPEFLNNFVEQRKTLFSESHKNSISSKRTGKKMVHKSEKPSSHKNSQLDKPSTEPQKANLASSKTIIQGSDGSIKAGKRSGKEFWEHTKKWSRGTLETYNAETDPEIKAVIRDMGKDLDRWITEKEIQEAADLRDKIPEKGQKFIKEKLAKVKREMELFGPQAVVSKYREYGDDKEEDYLWWLDLPSVLCIELYTVENGEQRVGLYSLEMAADLELDPKQYHDAFREAKANGFSVTVIRKGELQLNIDQTLEEVEELITEIGSKMYHDKITKERNVDINVLMKGVFGDTKPTKRGRRKQKSRRRIKP